MTFAYLLALCATIQIKALYKKTKHGLHPDSCTSKAVISSKQLLTILGTHARANTYRRAAPQLATTIRACLRRPLPTLLQSSRHPREKRLSHLRHPRWLDSATTDWLGCRLAIDRLRRREASVGRWRQGHRTCRMLGVRGQGARRPANSTSPMLSIQLHLLTAVLGRQCIWMDTNQACPGSGAHKPIISSARHPRRHKAMQHRR